MTPIEPVVAVLGVYFVGGVLVVFAAQRAVARLHPKRTRGTQRSRRPPSRMVESRVSLGSAVMRGFFALQSAALMRVSQLFGFGGLLKEAKRLSEGGPASGSSPARLRATTAVCGFRILLHLLFTFHHFLQDRARAPFDYPVVLVFLATELQFFVSLRTTFRVLHSIFSLCALVCSEEERMPAMTCQEMDFVLHASLARLLASVYSSDAPCQQVLSLVVALLRPGPKEDTPLLNACIFWGIFWGSFRIFGSLVHLLGYGYGPGGDVLPLAVHGSWFWQSFGFFVVHTLVGAELDAGFALQEPRPSLGWPHALLVRSAAFIEAALPQAAQPPPAKATSAAPAARQRHKKKQERHVPPVAAPLMPAALPLPAEPPMLPSLHTEALWSKAPARRRRAPPAALETASPGAATSEPVSPLVVLPLESPAADYLPKPTLQAAVSSPPLPPLPEPAESSLPLPPLASESLLPPVFQSFLPPLAGSQPSSASMPTETPLPRALPLPQPLPEPLLSSSEAAPPERPPFVPPAPDALPSELLLNKGFEEDVLTLDLPAVAVAPPPPSQALPLPLPLAAAENQDVDMDPELAMARLACRPSAQQLRARAAPQAIALSLQQSAEPPGGAPAAPPPWAPAASTELPLPLPLPGTPAALPELDINDDDACVVCLDKRRAYVVLPCVHFVLCASCVPAVRQMGCCPVCRGSVTDCKPLYR